MLTFRPNLSLALLLLPLTGCFLAPNDTLLGGYDAGGFNCTAICVAVTPQLQRDFGIANPACESAPFSQATTCAQCRDAFESAFGLTFTRACESAVVQPAVKDAGGDAAGGGAAGGGAAGGGAAGGGSAGGGAAGGGSAGGGAAGGGAAGGGAAGGGAAGPVIPAPPAISGAQCRWTPPAAGCLGGGASPCLLLHRPGQPPLPILTPGILGAGEELLGDTFLAGGELFHATANPATSSGRLWAAPLDGGARRELWDSVPNFSSASRLTGVVVSSYGAWLTARSEGTSRQVLLVAPGAPGAQGTATAIAPNLPSVSAADALGSDLFLAHEDGVYSYYPAGSSLLEAAQRVRAVAAKAGNEVYFTACGSLSRAGPCTLWRKTGSAAAVPLFTVSDGLASLVLRPEGAYALGSAALYFQPAAGGPAQQRYLGTPIVQAPDTLLPDSLRTDGERLYLSQVCAVDTADDTPAFATVELELSAPSARWLNTAQGFPYLPQVRSHQEVSTAAFPPRAGHARGTPSGLLVWH